MMLIQNHIPRLCAVVKVEEIEIGMNHEVVNLSERVVVAISYEKATGQKP